MDKILESVRLRRLFVIFFGSLLAVAILLRWLAIGTTTAAQPVREALAGILDGYIASSIVTALLGFIVYLGTSEIRKASEQIEVLAADDINRRFVEAQQKTKTWYFKGGLGRYFTSETLPNTLKNGESGYRFRAYLVDPFNAELCNYVASHRGNGETGSHIRTEALLTIVEFARHVHSKRTAVAEAQCGLIDDFAPLRIDLTDEGVFITHDKASAPAIFHRRESHFYSSYDQELTTGPNSYLVIDLVQLVQNLSNKRTEVPSHIQQAYASSVLNEACAMLNSQRAGENFQVSNGDVVAVLDAAPRRKSPY
jgi:hypothetical protein